MMLDNSEKAKIDLTIKCDSDSLTYSGKTGFQIAMAAGEKNVVDLIRRKKPELDVI